MSFGNEFKRMRERCLYTQDAFAKELGVAFSTVNRWEGGKARPNFTAMKKIKAFCEAHHTDYDKLEEAWLDFNGEIKKDE